MSAELKLTGVDELIAELKAFVPDVVGDTRPLELRMAQETADTLRAAYPSVTGALRASVTVEPAPSTSPARVFTGLRVGVDYAEFYEFGTAHQGATPTFVPITRRGREAFVKATVGLVERSGLEVKGDGV